jgi:hypothetical protein
MSSLVVIGRLSGIFHPVQGSVFNPPLGSINDLGFSSGLGQALSHRPPRPERVPYDFQCQDRFFFFKLDDGGSSIGSVEVREALVYDYQMRSEIDFTGFRVTVSLKRDAYQAYLDYIGEVREPTLSDQITWDGGILFRIPSRPFRFPMPRGSSDPWHPGKQIVGRLKVIKRFAFDEIEIQALRDEQGRRVKFDDSAREARSGWQPALSLRAQRSGIARSWMRMLRLGRE